MPRDEQYTLGIDFGTESGRVMLVRLSDGEEIAWSVVPYPSGVIDRCLPCGLALKHDWALQDPRDYLTVLTACVPKVLRESGVSPESVAGIGIDFTACTMLPTLADGTPLCILPQYASNPHAWVKLWKHHAAQPEANRINAVASARAEPFLRIYGGKVSSEWFFSKALQILDEAPEIYAAADRLIEAADWIVWQMTGQERRNECTAGYKGMWIDDVNLPVRCTDGTTDASGNYVTVLPQGWTADTWASNMANFMRLIRVSLPQTAILMHNAIWTAGGAALSAIVKAQIAACDFFYLERGISDPGLTGGTGPYSLTNWFSFIDKLHAEDTPVAMGEKSIATMEYSIAGLLMIALDGDMIGFWDQPLAAPWPALLGLDLGDAKGLRIHSGGLWSRQFTRGAVYLNEPGTVTTTITLPQPAWDISGREIAAITLGPGQGKVVLSEVS